MCLPAGYVSMMLRVYSSGQVPGPLQQQIGGNASGQAWRANGV